MYVYTIYRIWHFDNAQVATEREPAEFPAFTNFKECQKALIDFLSNYTTSRYFEIQEIKTGEYDHREMVEMKRKEMITAYAVYDLVNSRQGRDITRYLINRYKVV